MWVSKIENIETVQGIYKKKEPNLVNVFLHELSLSTGGDLTLVLKFDIRDMPNDLPNKWKIGKVNTVQILMEFIGVTIKSIGVNNTNCSSVSLIINELNNGVKQVKGLDNWGNCIFDIECKWIYVKNISGYCIEE